jgi:hypothetical protein
MDKVSLMLVRCFGLGGVKVREGEIEYLGLEGN